MSLSNFFESVSVTVTAYGDALKLEFGLIPEHVRVKFVSGTGPVYYSFNGDEDHGEVSSSFPESDMAISRNEMWLKGTAGDETVEVEAWA